MAKKMIKLNCMMCVRTIHSFAPGNTESAAEFMLSGCCGKCESLSCIPVGNLYEL